jgi:hypothetical protein
MYLEAFGNHLMVLQVFQVTVMVIKMTLMVLQATVMVLQVTVMVFKVMAMCRLRSRGCTYPGVYESPENNGYGVTCNGYGVTCNGYGVTVTRDGYSVRVDAYCGTGNGYGVTCNGYGVRVLRGGEDVRIQKLLEITCTNVVFLWCYCGVTGNGYGVTSNGNDRLWWYVRSRGCTYPVVSRSRLMVLQLVQVTLVLGTGLKVTVMVLR